jgi:predicted Rossmann fold flavoprotein
MAIDCLIIGSGAAGLVAGVASARTGGSTVLLEKNDRQGLKLLVTGGGRCNLTDPGRPPLESLGAFGRGGEFLRDALRTFSLAEFLASLGVETEIDPDDGRHYVKGGARRLVGAMLSALRCENVRLVTGARVVEFRKSGDTFVVRTEKTEFRAKRVVLATGGITYPTTGSSGDGYAWAKGLGHEIVPPAPALGALATNPNFAQFAGNTLADVELALTVAKRKAGRQRGTILFTHRGISGPAALDLSLDFARMRSRSEEAAEMTIDFLPSVSRDEIEKRTRRHAGRRIARTFEDAPWASALPSRLFAEIVRRAGIDPAFCADHVSRAEHRTLSGALKSTRLIVNGFEESDTCIVTFGGVSPKEINPKTMESRLVPGLFFAGEVVSLHGPCGGYNLLQAFSTGWLAGS